jgi:hypothetical protein
MKSVLVGLILALTASLCVAQAPGRVQTATRLVTIFSNLENQLADAVSENDSARAARLLADDFSQWTPQPPGSPVPRDQWLKSAGKDLGTFSIRQMSAKDLGEYVAVNFVLTTKTKAFFVVDLWKKAGTNWQLAERYLSSVDPGPYSGAERPTGKH